MAELKFSPELFLEVAELNHFKNSLDSLGFRKNILENTTSYGLIKNSTIDPNFTNGLVQRDVDSGGTKTIKINPILGIDNLGRFLYSENTINQIPVPNDGNWYWVKSKYASTNIEKGTISIGVDGHCTGSGGTEFTRWRGLPNFPSRVKFVNSVTNILEYNIQEIISDSEMILANPAVGISGLAEFDPQSDLQYKIVATTTPGIMIPDENKYPFIYDSISYDLVQETVLGERPTYIQNQEFYLARVLVSGADIIIQDQRLEYWRTGDGLMYEIERSANPLVGVEAVKYQVTTNPANKSIVEVGWGFRSSNWSINTSQNIVTISSGQGGKYKSVGDFVDQDFSGWRLYTGNGKYSKVISSVKVGGAINLSLSVLSVEDYSNDFGTTMIPQTLICVPDADEIEFQFLSDPADSTPSVNQNFSFPIADLMGKCELEVYKTNFVLYNVQYRLKKLVEFTEWTPLPSDNDNGYLLPESFDSKGVQIGTVRQTYASDPVNGFIKLIACPWSYSVFQNEVFKGDKIGVKTISALNSSTAYTLTVGETENYIYIGGPQFISSDTIFTLSTTEAVQGNEFKVHLKCSSLALGGNIIYFKQGSSILKAIAQGDVYSMLNIDNGIVFTFKFDGANWRVSQNYELGSKNEIKMIDGVLSDLFDVSGGVNNAKGKVKSLFGFCLCNHAATIDGVTIPDLSFRFLLGAGSDGTHSASPGDTGGNIDITLATGQLPAHNHNASQGFHSHTASDGSGHDHQTIDSLASTSLNDVGVADRVVMGSTGNEPSGTLSSRTSNEHVSISISTESAGAITIGDTGNGDSINIMPQYYAIIYCKRLY